MTFSPGGTAVPAMKDTMEKSRIRRMGYAPMGPAETEAGRWERWWDENKSYVFFSESAWYRWYIDPLARERGVPTADLRGAARATPSK